MYRGVEVGICVGVRGEYMGGGMCEDGEELDWSASWASNKAFIIFLFTPVCMLVFFINLSSTATWFPKELHASGGARTEADICSNIFSFCCSTVSVNFSAFKCRPGSGKKGVVVFTLLLGRGMWSYG